MVFYVSSYNEFQKEMSNFSKIVKGKYVQRLEYIFVSVDGNKMTLTGTNGYTAYERVMEIDNPNDVKVEFTIPIETAKVFKRVKGDARLQIELQDNITLFSYDNQTITCINDKDVFKRYATTISQILHKEHKNEHRLKIDAKLLIDILRSFDKPYIVIDLDSNTEPIRVEENEFGQKKAIVLPIRFSDE